MQQSSVSPVDMCHGQSSHVVGMRPGRMEPWRGEKNGSESHIKKQWDAFIANEIDIRWR